MCRLPLVILLKSCALLVFLFKQLVYHISLYKWTAFILEKNLITFPTAKTKTYYIKKKLHLGKEKALFFGLSIAIFPDPIEIVHSSI